MPRSIHPLSLVSLCVAALLAIAIVRASQAENTAPKFGRWNAPGTTQARAARANSSAKSSAKSKRSAAADPQEVEPKISLNYLDAGWARVLKDVAEKSRKQLVMERIPIGRLVRRDRKEHTLESAVEVLNKELESKGFRLMIMREYLVVMHLKAARSKYPRPELAGNMTATPQALAPRNAEPLRPEYQRKFSTVTPSRQSAERDITSRENDRWLKSDIQQAGFENESTPKNGANTPPSRNPLEDNPVVQLAVTLEKRRAVDVARVVYSAFKSRAKLIHQGPDGLPAFEVHQEQVTHALMPNANDPGVIQRQPTEAVALFSIAIDGTKNRLLVHGPKDRVRGLASLIQRLDVNAATPNDTVKFFPATQKEAAVASKLGPHLKRLMHEKSKPQAAAPTGRLDDFDRAFRLAQAQRQPKPANPANPDPPAIDPNVPGNPIRNVNPNGASEDLPFDRIRSNVDIDVVPGVGLVLKGNMVDVDAVMEIIAGIVRASRGAVPAIHLLTLRHVNSEALSTLLTSVYERLDQLRARGLNQGTGGGANNATLAFFPVVKPNAILILASGVDMESIIALADELDKPVDPAAEIEVIPLKYAIASQVQEMVEEFYQGRLGLGARVQIGADFRTNALIVHARPNDLAEVQRLVLKIDKDESPAVSGLKVVVLKNAVAEELATVINTAIQTVLNPGSTTGAGGAFAGGGGQGAQQLREAKSVVLEFLRTQDGKPIKVKSGLLADIRVTSDARMNALLITAPAQSLDMLEALITHLDQPSPTVAEIKVFTLENSDASQAGELLSSLFGDQNQEGQIGVQLAGAEDASSSLVPLRFSVDVRTNSIVAVGGAEALRIVEAVLLRLDESDVRRRQTTVLELKNAPVTEIATAINLFLTQQQALAQLDPDLVSNIEQLEREIIVVPEPVTNNLLISATARYYDDIMKMIQRLDEAPPQVQIQALMIEVELDNTDEFGVELGFQDSALFNRSLIQDVVTISETFTNPNGNQQTNQTIVSQTGNPGFAFNNQPFGNNISGRSSRGSLGSQGLSNFNLGRVNSDLDFGGFVFSASSDSVNILVRALAARRNVHILSRPQIRTVDNQLAQILVGQLVPVISSVSVNDNGNAQPQVQQQEAGIILTVTPRISPDGNIVMETVAEKSSFNTNNGVPLFVDSNGQTFNSPVKDVITASTTVSVPNGQTVVLGGMITKRDDSLERKVPWLGDIPIIGIPFRYDSKTTRRTELLIFLTPRIILSNQDSEVIKQVESERLRFFQHDAEAMHGPLYAIPAELDLKARGATQITPTHEPAPVPLMDLDDTDAPTTIVPRGAFRLPPSAIQETGMRSVGDARRRRQ
ncbi:MAG: hypothetical protein O3A00_14980 [Planctomycetota bacterium]|nr:hypothetical protein [Planctomycetota bacterium]